MAIFAGNFVYKTSFGLQCRVLLIPWMKKSSGIGCSNGRANSSSFPVKYIPKKTLKTEEPQTSSTPMKGPEDEVNNGLDQNALRFEVSNDGKSLQRSFVLDKNSQNQRPIRYLAYDANQEVKEEIDYEEPQTSSTPMKGREDKEISNGLDQNASRIEVSNERKSLQRSFVLDKKSQNQNQNQRPILYLTYDANQVKEEIDYDEGVVEFECIEKPEVLVEELEIRQENKFHNQDLLQAAKTKQDAEKLAVELLATRAFTTVQLRKKLNGKKFPLDIIDAVITDFQSRGLINDSLYAETFSRSRWSSSSWGPRRIKQALFKKGVSEVDTEKAIKLVFQDTDSGGDQESRLGLSKVSMDHLFVQASKQWLRGGRDVTNETRKSRIIRWLQYRGFNWGVISFILKKLESENPS